MSQQSSKSKKVMKPCSICECDIPRKSLANHLRIDGLLLEIGERKKCNNCNLITETNKFENHIVSDRQIMNPTKVLKNKMGCVTCNRDINQNLYENLSGVLFHINNLIETIMQ